MSNEENIKQEEQENMRKHIDSPEIVMPAYQKEIDSGTADLELYTKDEAGVKNGPYIRTWQNRQVVAKGFCKNGELDGPFKTYINRKLVSDGTHKAGKLDGIMHKYDVNGNVVEEHHYKDGAEIH